MWGFCCIESTLVSNYEDSSFAEPCLSLKNTPMGYETSKEVKEYDLEIISLRMRILELEKEILILKQRERVVDKNSTSSYIAEL